MVKILISCTILLFVFICYVVHGFKNGTKASIKNILIHISCIVFATVCAVVIHKLCPINFGVVFVEQNTNILLTKLIPKNMVELFTKIFFVQHYNSLVLFILYMLFYNMTHHFIHFNTNTGYFENRLTVTSRIGGVFLGVVNCALACTMVAMLLTQTILGMCL